MRSIQFETLTVVDRKFRLSLPIFLDEDVFNNMFNSWLALFCRNCLALEKFTVHNHTQALKYIFIFNILKLINNEKLW